MRIAALLLALLLPGTLRAAPARYALDLDATEVGFTWYLGKDAVAGRMPVAAADVTLDFERASDSQFTVTLNAAQAQAGFVFATQALKGPTMLDTATYPTITFKAERITRSGEDIVTAGLVTVHGVTRPMSMTAGFFRPADQPPGDHSHVVVLLEGHLDRNEFGASGWPEAVGPRVDLQIRAVLDRMP